MAILSIGACLIVVVLISPDRIVLNCRLRQIDSNRWEQAKL
jgi:hypothetical protein